MAIPLPLDSTYPMGYDEHGNELRSPASEIHQANTANIENNYLSFNTGATINLTKDWKIEIDYTYAGEDQYGRKRYQIHCCQYVECSCQKIGRERTTNICQQSR